MGDKKPTLQEKLREYIRLKGYENLELRTGIYSTGLKKIVDGDATHKFTRTIIDKLYEFFDLEFDDWYIQNMRKRYKPTESAIGDIFRLKRLQLGKTPQQVEKDINISVRQLMRIEAGDSLPSYKGYAINALCKYYEFNRQETEKIRWAVCILQDILKIRNTMADKYDIEKGGEDK